MEGNGPTLVTQKMRTNQAILLTRIGLVSLLLCGATRGYWKCRIGENPRRRGRENVRDHFQVAMSRIESLSWGVLAGPTVNICENLVPDTVGPTIKIAVPGEPLLLRAIDYGAACEYADCHHLFRAVPVFIPSLGEIPTELDPQARNPS